MQSVSSRIWTRVAVSISYDDNYYTTGTIPKTFKMVLDTSLLYTQQYKGRIKDKVVQSRERSSALHYPSSNSKGSLLVALDYGRQLYSLN